MIGTMTEEERALAMRRANEEDEYKREHLRWIRLTSPKRKQMLRAMIRAALYPRGA